MIFTSPLRYPGGKKRIAGFIQKVCNDNNLHNCYIEPFAGGASIALNLLMCGTVRRIILNDKDISIFAFWHSVLFHTEELCSMILSCDINLDTWHQQRIIQKNKTNEDLLSLGFATLFLNRTNRSGILSAGVIGGQAQSGLYKIDCRFNKHDIVNKIRTISKFKDHIVLYNLDAIELLHNLRHEINDNNLFYLDPPYYEKGSCLYLNHYKHSDHEKLIAYILGMNVNWLVSYDEANIIKLLFHNVRQIEYELNHSAYTSKRGNEVMFFSNNLLVNLDSSPVSYNLCTNPLDIPKERQ